MGESSFINNSHPSCLHGNNTRAVSSTLSSQQEQWGTVESVCAAHAAFAHFHEILQGIQMALKLLAAQFISAKRGDLQFRGYLKWFENNIGNSDHCPALCKANYNELTAVWTVRSALRTGNWSGVLNEQLFFVDNNKIEFKWLFHIYLLVVSVEAFSLLLYLTEMTDKNPI